MNQVFLHKVRRKSDGLFYGKLGWTQEGQLFQSVACAVQYLKDNSHRFREPSVINQDDLSNVEIVTYSATEYCTCSVNVYLENNPINHLAPSLRKKGMFLYNVLIKGEYIDSMDPSGNFLIHKDVHDHFLVNDILMIPNMNILLLRDIVAGFTHKVCGKYRFVFQFNKNGRTISINPLFRRFEKEPDAKTEGLNEKVEEMEKIKIKETREFA